MNKNNKKHRKNIRLKNYDYTTNGAYFVTICTDFKREYIHKKERLIIEHELVMLQNRFKGTEIDFYTIMSNHIHFVLFLDNCAVSLSRIIQAFKSISTLQLKNQGLIKEFFGRGTFMSI